LRRCAGRSATEIKSGLEDAVLRSGTTEFRDDIVVLVLRLPDRDGGPAET
jgi:hypothetical protein